MFKFLAYFDSRFCKFLVFVFSISLACLLSSSANGLSVSDVYIKRSDNLSNIGVSYKAIKLNDEIMVSTDDMIDIMSLEYINQAKFNYSTVNGRIFSDPIQIRGHSSNLDLVFNLKSNEVEVSRGDKVKMDSFPAEYSPISIDNVTYLPFKLIYGYIKDDEFTLYEESENTLFYDLTEQQKAFLTDFPQNKIKTCRGDRINWDNRYLIFEKDNKQGVLDYIGNDDKITSLNRLNYEKYKIIVEPIYDSISCEDQNDGMLVLKAGNSYRIFDEYRSVMSKEYSALNIIQNGTDWLSEEETRSIDLYIGNDKKDQGCGDVMGEVYGSAPEGYVVRKNNKLGVYTHTIVSDIIYDQVEVKLGHRDYCGKKGTFNYMFLNKGDKRYLYIKNKLVDFDEIKKTRVLHITSISLVVGVVLVLTVVLFINKNKLNFRKSKKI